jgi:hypothetical protein
MSSATPGIVVDAGAVQTVADPGGTDQEGAFSKRKPDQLAQRGNLAAAQETPVRLARTRVTVSTGMRGSRSASASGRHSTGDRNGGVMSDISGHRCSGCRQLPELPFVRPLAGLAAAITLDALAGTTRDAPGFLAWTAVR